MKIFRESMNHYLAWIRSGWRFSFAGFSDAEWYSVLGQRLGERTGLGQVIDADHGRCLAAILRRRQYTANFLFAIPHCLWPSRDADGLPGFAEGQIDWWLGRENISIKGYERDMVLDDVAAAGDLFPLIQEARKHDVCLIGPEPLRCMVPILAGRGRPSLQGDGLRAQQAVFVPIETPNLHLKPLGIDNAVRRALESGVKGMYLISAGVSAAAIIDQLHDELTEHSWLIDCGSIWDAFAGIGGQRGWRAELYADPVKWEAWKNRCLTEKPKWAS